MPVTTAAVQELAIVAGHEVKPSSLENPVVICRCSQSQSRLLLINLHIYIIIYCFVALSDCFAWNCREYAEDGHCRPCHASCLSCTGPSSADCGSCMPNMYLHSGSCVQSCPLGFYAAATDCDRCPGSCETCDDARVCTSCVSPTVLDGFQCVLCCDEAVGLASDCCVCDDAKGRSDTGLVSFQLQKFCIVYLLTSVMFSPQFVVCLFVCLS